MSVVIPPLTELFPEGDYAFRLTLRRAEPREFFGRMDTSGAMLRERERWLSESPGRYAALQPEGDALLAEFWELAGGWDAEVAGKSEGCWTMAEVGRRFEPDILLLGRDAAGAFRLRGGALCFPTGWALEERMGQTLEDIHGVVPGLNAALGAQIGQFLARLRPGLAYVRHNWGIATTDELNLHPARGVPAPEVFTP